MHSEVYKGITGPAAPREGYAGAPDIHSAEVAKAHFLGRLENALSRLMRATDRQVELAQAMTGGWPTGGQKVGDAPVNAGIFGAIEEIAAAIHRNCDRMEEANLAVADRLP